MRSFERPDAIDTRLVFRVYGGIVAGFGLLVYLWPLRFLPDTWAQSLVSDPTLRGIPWGGFAVVRIAAAGLVALGLCAVAFSRIDDPMSRRRALFHFGFVHLLAGAMVWLQWTAVLSAAVPAPPLAWPVTVGVVLLYFAITENDADLRRPLRGVITLLNSEPEEVPVDRLKSQYEEQIARVARQEERARLARDLHDAVKQQLFVIQTSAATAQTRFDDDAAGARTALDQIRTSAREAVTEMQALLDQLQAPPLANAGLTDALRQQCDALRFRTGADVTFTADPLPPEWALPPGTPEALFRIAQEALANVARHARARTVLVRIDAVAGRLALTVKDDGAGFDPDSAASGLGRGNMRTRAAEIQGTFELWSRPGGGTMIKVTVPYETTTPAEFRNKALLWGAVTVALVTVLMMVPDDVPGALVFAAITAGVGACRYALAFVRLRRRAGAAA